uniref:ATPase AAA-type core domain-containing protein n=1 Tax=Parascaris equorum TaxID=6256 RepID=A0A914S5U7_PAREQ
MADCDFFALNEGRRVIGKSFPRVWELHREWLSFKGLSDVFFTSAVDARWSQHNAIIVMGATNRPYDVDKAILRRMPARFYVPLPDAQSRADILKVILRREPMESGINFQRIAEAASNLIVALFTSLDYLLYGIFLCPSEQHRCAFRYDETARMLREEDLIRAVVKYTETALTSKMPLLIPESLD